MHLFDPIEVRDVRLRNRIAVSPMCQYSCPERDGRATGWHLVHLGSRAVGGAGLVLTEATAVTPEGRISPEDLGIWDDRQVEALRPVAAFIREQGAVPGMQLAHAGRKGSTSKSWERPAAGIPPAEGGWTPVAPSPLPFAPNYPAPRALLASEIPAVAAAFGRAARRALEAGFELVELHAGHGYLLHEFLSPLTNHRDDDYGGTFEGRTRLVLQTAEAIRTAWPERLPLFVRLSVTDWAESGGWDVEQSVELARALKDRGVDLIDCSSGSLARDLPRPEAPGYMVGFADRIRRETGIATAALGVIKDARQAAAIVAEQRADLVTIARAMLYDPYWPLHAARVLGVDLPYWPPQYTRVKTFDERIDGAG